MTRKTDNFSFTRARRLDGPHAYAAVFAFKCSVSGSLFQIYARPNGSTAARLGIVISKRTIPHAVERNYCKRLAREVFRTERIALAGVDVIVRPRAVLKHGSSAAARAEIRELLYRVCRQCRSRDETRPRQDNA